MTQKSEKIWVVVESGADGHINAAAYDNETDAGNYAIEMGAMHGDKKRVKVVGTELIRRREGLPSDDAPWGMLRLDVKSEFVEGLMEEMIPAGRILPGAAERFVSEKMDTVRKRAASRFDEILKSETKEELVHTYEEWARAKGMED
jgi:hypothetical protein